MPASPHATRFVLLTIFIDAIGFGIVMPVIPRLVMEVGGIDLPGAVAVGGWMALLYAGFQFVLGPVMGNLGDRFGRRPVLLGALAGYALDYLLMALAQTLPLLYLGRALAGVFGGSFGPAQAAIADVTSPEQRARAFGFVGAAFGVGFVTGPAIGGLLGEFDARAPFYAAAALAAMNFTYGFFFFPETLPPDKRRPFEWRRANPVGAFRMAAKLPGILPVATVLLLWNVASFVYPLTWSYYAIARFGWSPGMIGASLAVVGLSIATGQILLTGRVVKRYGERTAATIGLIAATVGFVGYALITESWMAFALIAILALQALVQPSLTAMLSRRATPETQGEMQGFTAGVLALGALVAPMILNPALSWFTSDAAPFRFSGAAFVVAAVVAIAAIIVLRFAPKASDPV